MEIIEAIIIAIVEGLTEFLPVSSTGHMIIASTFLGIQTEDYTKLFTVAIQFGAILAVVVLYWSKFIQLHRWQFYVKLLIGVLPALILGYLFSDKIDTLLESPLTVGVFLVLGGIILLYVDKWFINPRYESDDQISYKKSFIVGLWQCIAMIPGVSRSAASIIGGMSEKFTRNLAAEFSFFLAVPTMFAASVYTVFIKDFGANDEIQKGYQIILSSSKNTTAFIVGNIVAFVIALLAIKFFINYLKIYGFKLFGYYRIVAGLILLALLATGVIA